MLYLTYLNIYLVVSLSYVIESLNKGWFTVLLNL